MKQDWEQLTNQVVSIETSINKTVYQLEIIPLAEKIGILNRTLLFIP